MVLMGLLDAEGWEFTGKENGTGCPCVPTRLDWIKIPKYTEWPSLNGEVKATGIELGYISEISISRRRPKNNPPP